MIFFAQDFIRILAHQITQYLCVVLILCLYCLFKPLFLFGLQAEGYSGILASMQFAFRVHGLRIYGFLELHNLNLKMYCHMYYIIALHKVMYGDFRHETNGVKRRRSHSEKACNDVPYTRLAGFFH